MRPGAHGTIDHPVLKGHPHVLCYHQVAEPAPQDSMALKDCTRGPECKTRGVHQSMETFPWRVCHLGSLGLGVMRQWSQNVPTLVSPVLRPFSFRPITCSSPPLLCRTEGLTLRARLHFLSSSMRWLLADSANEEGRRKKETRVFIPCSLCFRWHLQP